MTTKSMDVFSLRDAVVGEYKKFATSFTTIHAEDIRQQVEAIYAHGRYWPEPLIQINPSYKTSKNIEELVAEGMLQPECAAIFRTPPEVDAPKGKPLSLHEHQKEAISIALDGESYVVTTGTGSGKSLCFFIPIVNAVLAEKRHGNLTLTGYNPEYSDRPFEDKKTIKGGLNESSVRLNKFIREQSTWTDAQMQERGAALAKQALGIWRRLVVDDAEVKKAERDELQARAMARKISDVPMSGGARALFELLSPHVRALGAQVVEVAESHSVSYHAADFFLEVIPRKHRLTLSLDLDFNECKDVDSQTLDATAYQSIHNSTHQGGVLYRFDHADQLDGAMRMIRLAHELSST